MSYPLFHPNNPSPIPRLINAKRFTSEFPCESEHIEFKEGAPLDGIAETAVAFSNADGGVILLGVFDDGIVKGINLSAGKETKIRNHLTQAAELGAYQIHRINVSGQKVVAIGVSRQRNGFAELKDGRIKERRGALNHTLRGHQLADFISRRFVRFPDISPTTSTPDNINTDLAQQLATAWGWSVPSGMSPTLKQLLRENGFLSLESNGERLSIAGALYLLNDPGRVLGKAYVEVFRYRDEGVDYDRRAEFRGPLQAQATDTTQFILDELGFDMALIGVKRHELHRLPRVVVREAVANAIAHRSYAKNAEAVHIEIRPDRLVIRSPGGLPEGVTLDRLSQQSVPRNLLVIRTLRYFGVAEDAGRGVDLMHAHMTMNLMEQPRFDADDSSVTVTLHLGSHATPVERAWLEQTLTEGASTATQPYSVGEHKPSKHSTVARDVLPLLQAGRGESLTNGRVCDLLNMDTRQAGEVLRHLRDRGLLEQFGTGSGTTYGLAPHITSPTGIHFQQRDYASEVLALASGGQITNANVRAETGLDRAAVVRILNRLVFNGQLERHGSKRGTYYSLTSRPEQT